MIWKIRQAGKHPTIAQNANVIRGCVERGEHIPNSDKSSVHFSMPKTMELPNSTRIVLGCCIEMYTALRLNRKPFVPSFIEMHSVFEFGIISCERFIALAYAPRCPQRRETGTAQRKAAGRAWAGDCGFTR